MNPAFHEWFGDEYLEEYQTGVFSDELDKLGHRHRVATSWKLNRPGARCFGRVRTLSIETVETDDEHLHDGLSFLTSLAPDDVLVIKGSRDFAYFGELMSRLAEKVGLSGVVIDGLTRDTYYTRRIELPIFAKGYSPVDIKGRGRVAKLDERVMIDGICVHPGDWLFGDSDAVVTVPQALMPSLRDRVLEAVRDEAAIKESIAAGASVDELLARFKEF